MAETDIAGGCLCGAVRFRLTAPPVATRYCWCRTCQYIAAGNASVNVVVPTDAVVVVQGQPAVFQNTAASGNGMNRRFCPACGAHLFSNSEGRPHLTVVRAGVLDDPDIADPTAAIWVSSAPRWACIAEDLQQFPAQPPPA